MNQRDGRKPDYIISLDVGTSNAKAVLFDVEGRELLVEEHSFALSTPAESRVEQDGEEIVEASLRVIELLVDAYPKLSTSSSVLSLSTQGGSLIPVDRKGRPLHPMITWMDRRAAAILEGWRSDGTAARVRELSGWWPQPGLPLLTISWLRKHKREIFENTDLFLSLSDFLSLRLGGRAITDPSNAGEMLLLERLRSDWSAELCGIAGIDANRLAAVEPADAVIGTITAETAKRCELPADTPLINGGQDHSCELLAIGDNTQEEALLACGTAWVINGLSSSGSLDHIPETMDLNHHLLDGLWSVSQFLGPFGADFNWCVRQCYTNDGVQDYREMERQLADVCLREEDIPGHPLSIPLSGSSQAMQERQTAGDGTPVPAGGFLGLGKHHGREDLILSIMEGAAFELRWAIEKLEHAGFPLRSLWMVGGAVRNPYWPTIVADVTGLQVRTISYSHGPALGAAILAGTGTEIYTDISEAKNRFALEHREIEPTPGRARLYTEKFDEYKSFARFASLE